VLVRDRSPQTDRIASVLGSPPRIVSTASVCTEAADEFALDCFLMVYEGTNIKRIVELF
jgi:hypothetical protein